MKPVYKADFVITLESDTENALDPEWCYETMRKALRNTLNAPKRTRLTHFAIMDEYDVEGKQIIRGGGCYDCEGEEAEVEAEPKIQIES